MDRFLNSDRRVSGLGPDTRQDPIQIHRVHWDVCGKLNRYMWNPKSRRRVRSNFWIRSVPLDGASLMVRVLDLGRLHFRYPIPSKDHRVYWDIRAS